MKNILLLLAVSICLLTVSCSKQADNSPPTTVQHSAARELQNHTATIQEANGWVTAYNTAHPSDTANKTMFVEKELLGAIASNPDVSFVSMRLALGDDGHNTIVFTGWDSTGQSIISVDQHIGIACMQCKCCTDVAIHGDGTLPL